MKLASKEKIIDLTKGSLGTFIKKYYQYFGEPIKITKENAKYLKKGHIITTNTFLPNDEHYKKVANEYNIPMKYHPKYGLMRSGYSRPIVSVPSHMMVVLDPKNKILLHNTIAYSSRITPPGTGLTLQVDRMPMIFDNPEKYRVYLYDLRKIDELIKILEKEKEKEKEEK
jgi:hypothetical protein